MADAEDLERETKTRRLRLDRAGERCCSFDALIPISLMSCGPIWRSDPTLPCQVDEACGRGGGLQMVI
jgi:hypothetical protein